jgi:hypothetical protein
VLSQILASSEFYARAQTLVSSGSADERYVEAMYQVLLGRTGSASEVAGWVQAPSSIGAQGAAQAFLSGTEYRTDLADSYYNALLHRPPDSALADWVLSRLDAGEMRVGFESSGEFFANGHETMRNGPRARSARHVGHLHAFGAMVAMPVRAARKRLTTPVAESMA